MTKDPVFSPGLDPFGFPTIQRPWDNGSDSVFNAKRRMHAAFEFMSKLGVKYWSFHDRRVDIHRADNSQLVFTDCRVS